jgi:hypothetical protein
MTVIKLPETDFATASTVENEDPHFLRKYVTTNWFPHMPHESIDVLTFDPYAFEFFNELCARINDALPLHSIVHVFLRSEPKQPTEDMPHTLEECTLYVSMLGPLSDAEIESLDKAVDTFITAKLEWDPAKITMIS